jgi:glutathione S-transferase
MILYDSPMPAPNPRRVRIFLAEKKVQIDTKLISIIDREHRSDEYLKVNPLGQTPALMLEEGKVLTESIAICRYLESLYPSPPLFGVGALNSAEIDMWIRRVDLRLGRATSLVWLHTHAYTANFVQPQYRDFGESQRSIVLAIMAEFNISLHNREWLDGVGFSIADIALLTQLDFAIFVGLAIPDDLSHLKGWHNRVTLRSSSSA